MMFGMMPTTGIRIFQTVDFQHKRNQAMMVAMSIGVGMHPRWPRVSIRGCPTLFIH